MQTIDTSRGNAVVTTEVCPRCRFHPVSPRAEGYCSWDCYDADDDEDADEDDAEAA